MRSIMGFLILLLSFPMVSAQQQDDTTPGLEHGAEVFWKRCVMCHGAQGMGEGKIPLKIKGYPDTNIVTANKTVTQKEILNVVVFGGMLPNINQFMPPLGNELTWTELESVSMFVFQLRKNPEKHYKMLKQFSHAEEETPGLGLSVYQSRCMLCHGQNAEGDGRMSRIIKSPPPYNLTKSDVPLEYVKLIVEKGGELIGRSKQMPPWGDQLSEEEIDAVSEYVLTLRN